MEERENIGSDGGCLRVGRTDLKQDAKKLLNKFVSKTDRWSEEPRGGLVEHENTIEGSDT